MFTPPGLRPQAANVYFIPENILYLFFSSHINIFRNGRLAYARELGKYINVDIYGACGPHRCPRTSANKCFQLLDQDYKFYLAFENSNCKVELQTNLCDDFAIMQKASTRANAKLVCLGQVLLTRIRGLLCD